MLFLFPSFGAELLSIFDVGNAVTDMVYREGKLYIATEEGSVKLIDLKEKKTLKVIELPLIRDFMGNPIPPKVFSVDVSPSGDKVLIVSESSGGFSEVYLFTDEKGLEKLIDLGKGFMIMKGRFVSEDKALMGFLGDELGLLDIKSRKFIYKAQIGFSSLSDMCMSDDRKKVAVSDESGEVKLVSVKNGKLIKRFRGVNVDKLYSIDCKGRKIMVGGKDRRVALYYTDGTKPKMFKTKFFVFSVAINQRATLGAYLYDENNTVLVVDLESGKEVDRLTGHSYPVSKMLFIDSFIIAGCDDGKIYLWRLER